MTEEELAPQDAQMLEDLYEAFEHGDEAVLRVLRELSFVAMTLGLSLAIFNLEQGSHSSMDSVMHELRGIRDEWRAVAEAMAEENQTRG